MDQVQALGAGQAAVGVRHINPPARLASAVRPRYFLSAALLILLIGFVLRIWNLGGASLWTDEVLTAARAQSSFRESLDSILNAGNQTPLYFLSLHLVPNQTEMLLRLPSALLGLLGIALLMAITRRLYRSHAMALWAGALVAVSPYHVLLSRTARPYALIFALTLIVSYCFLLFLRGHRSSLVWIVFTIGSAIAYITHYTTLAMLGAQIVLIVLLLRDDRRFLKRWLTAQGVAAVPDLIWLYITTNHPVQVGPAWVPVPTLGDLPLTLWNMTIGYDGVLKWYLIPALLIVALSLIAGVRDVVLDWKRDRVNFYWLMLVAGPLLGVFLISALIISFYVDRYFMVFLPGLVLLMLQGFKKSPRWLAEIALGIVVVTAMGMVISSFHRGDYQRADWRGAAAYVAEQYQPGDGILLERMNTQQAFFHYYEAAPPEGIDLVRLYESPDTAEFEQANTRIWVIYRNPNENVHRQGAMPDFDPFQIGLTPMGDWLSERRADVIERRKFSGVAVLLIEPGRRLASQQESDSENPVIEE